MVSARLIRDYRASLAALTGLAANDLRVFFAEYDTAEEIRAGLEDLLPRMVALYGSAAASLAADWYDEVRAELQPDGRARAVTAELPDRGRTDSLAGWGTTSLFAVEPDKALAVSKVVGGVQRIVADAGRQTIIRSVGTDPAASGWGRSTTGTGCDFCRLVAGRGAVYSADTADFASHDHCNCIAVPVYGDSQRVRAYVPSQRFRTPEARARHNADLRAALNSGTYDT